MTPGSIARSEGRAGEPCRSAAQSATFRREGTGGTPYGASTLAGPDGSRQPTENELAIAGFQGRHVAAIARRLKAGSA